MSDPDKLTFIKSCLVQLGTSSVFFSIILVWLFLSISQFLAEPKFLRLARYFANSLKGIAENVGKNPGCAWGFKVQRSM